jgi:pyrophosphatase PpaX
MPYRVVLFDLDGTLVDSIELIVLAATHAFTTVRGHSPERAEIMAQIGKPLMVQFGAYARDEAELHRYLTAYREHQLAHHDALTRPYPGVNDVVAGLTAAGHSLGVVTSKIEPLAHRALDHVGLRDHFPLVVGIESTARHKPNPEPLLFAMDRLAAAPQECVYVGDSPFDLQAARAARIDSIAVTWGAFTGEALGREAPTAVARTPAELRALLS